MRVSKKDVGCICVVNWEDAEPEKGIIVSAKYGGILVYFIDRHELEKVESNQITNVSKCRLTLEDIEDLYGSPSAWKVLPSDIMQTLKQL